MTLYELEETKDLARLGNNSALNDLVDYFYEKKDYEKAFLHAQKFLYTNDSRGLRKLGFFYERGIGTEIDIEKAKECYQKAFDLEDYVAGYNLALIYQKEEKYDKCLYYLSIGKYYGHIPSIKLLADLYFKGDKIEKNLEVAIELYKILVDSGESKYLDYIGKAYYQLEQYDYAFSYFQKGSELLIPDSIYHLAICYSKGQGTRIDISKAIELYEKAIKYGHIGSIYNLALHYLNGVGVPKDAQKGNDLMKMYEDKKTFIKNK